ncbi:unnamed protein product [Callosobruchus maculatus]|uniref:Uncharacterized protein n=1 Tax=Callosobruchus maculatus TaxID=64391 RepID=A0A653CCW8_CALMS|nr:unnamed protein product [Callosobruchus maculatus]
MSPTATLISQPTNLSNSLTTFRNRQQEYGNSNSVNSLFTSYPTPTTNWYQYHSSDQYQRVPGDNDPLTGKQPLPAFDAL